MPIMGQSRWGAMAEMDANGGRWERPTQPSISLWTDRFGRTLGAARFVYEVKGSHLAPEDHRARGTQAGGYEIEHLVRKGTAVRKYVGTGRVRGHCWDFQHSACRRPTRCAGHSHVNRDSHRIGCYQWRRTGHLRRTWSACLRNSRPRMDSALRPDTRCRGGGHEADMDISDRPQRWWRSCARPLAPGNAISCPRAGAIGSHRSRLLCTSDHGCA